MINPRVLTRQIPSNQKNKPKFMNKLIKRAIGVVAVIYFVAMIFTSCSPVTIERSVKSKQYAFAKKCANGTCATYGANKRSHDSRAYGFR